MGARNSKINPSASSSLGSATDKASGCDETKIEVSHESIPHMSLYRSTSGPPLHLITRADSTSETPLKQHTPQSLSNNHNSFSPQTKKCKFSVGDKILGNFDDAGKWFPGIITKCEDGLFDILYDDGDAEDNVPATSIKARAKGPLGSLILKTGLSNSPPLAATKTGPVMHVTNKVSKIVSVKSSSTLSTMVDTSNESSTEVISSHTGFGDNRTHSGSFNQLPLSDKKQSYQKPVGNSTQEVDDYGEYDGSLDFVPRTASKKCMKASAAPNEVDDDFSELEEMDRRKHLLSNTGLASEEGNSAAVVKNLFREDSKNILLTSPQPWEDAKTVAKDEEAGAGAGAGAVVDVSSPAVTQKGFVEESVVATTSLGTSYEHRPRHEEELSAEGVNEEKAQDGACENIHAQQQEMNDNIARNFVKHEIATDEKRLKKKKKKDKEKDKEKDMSPPASTHVDTDKLLHNHQKVQVPHVHVHVLQKQSEIKEVWDPTDDDLFGMGGMGIQRVDSVESLGGGRGEDEADISYYDDSHGHGHGQQQDQDQDYDGQDHYMGSHDDSFFNPNVAEQSHADSFYSSDHHSYESGPDWGRISEQSAKLYELDDEELGEQEGGDSAPTDSGWSLCYTADGTPYFYSYVLQESCWELPSSTRSPMQGGHAQAAAQAKSYIQWGDELQSASGSSASSPLAARVTGSTGSTGSTSSPTRHVSRGVAQSKHELAKALNSNKAKSTLHLTNLTDTGDNDDEAPYDLGLGTMGMLAQPLKKVSSASGLKDMSTGSPEVKQASRGMKRPQSMAAMRRKKKDLDF